MSGFVKASFCRYAERKIRYASNEAQKSHIVCVLLDCDAPILVRHGKDESDPVSIVDDC